MPTARRARGPALGAILVGLSLAAAPPGGGPFDRFDLPDAWEARFWAEPGVKALLTLEPKAVAALVPTQAGLRYCSCPACHADEADDPLSWTAETPEILTCKRCKATFPDDKYPAKVDGKVPEVAVEVLPRLFHKYPFHAIEPEKQAYPEERAFLAARRDDRAREFLAKAALYAAVRHHEAPAGSRDPALARLACVLLLRFAQVYPAYATHLDQPGRPKQLDRADLAPPYRRGFGTAKWDWSGCLGVPLNLVVAHALMRDDPAMAEAGKLLGDAQPRRTIEHDLLRASAEFVLHQPEELQEQSLVATRGLLAVGRVLGDESLLKEGSRRLATFAERGFTYDGLWCQANMAAHRRIVGQLDGWIGRLLPAVGEPPPMLALARTAGGAAVSDPRGSEVVQASWPPPVAAAETPRRPILLGGAGLARLAVGSGADAFDLELCGFGDQGGPHGNRLAIRLAVGGVPILGDLDDLPPSPGGFELATASHNAVVVDGLNQRETPALARGLAPGADCLFFAADPDFQVATMEDPRAYPHSTDRYRHTLIAASGAKARYGVGIFEVRGGIQHDQLFQAAPGSRATWRPSTSMVEGPATLLPPSITHVANARAEDGRWFVQAFGEFDRLSMGKVAGPATADLRAGDSPGVRLHLLDEGPMTIFAGRTPEPSDDAKGDDSGRAALILRRRSEDGASIATTFVTVFAPTGASVTGLAVARVASPPGSVVLGLRTADGPEHLVFNTTPGTRRAVKLADGRTLATDGLVVRVSAGGLILAGGTFAELEGVRIEQAPAAGKIRNVIRRAESNARGVFEADAPLKDPEALAGRTLLIRHGDGTVRGWTLVRAENIPKGARLHVLEEPGFRLSPEDGSAEYYQFPRGNLPGPHTFRIARMARTASVR